MKRLLLPVSPEDPILMILLERSSSLQICLTSQVVDASVLLDDHLNMHNLNALHCTDKVDRDIRKEPVSGSCDLHSCFATPLPSLDQLRLLGS